MEEPCNEKRSLFLCYPDDFEGETESLGLRCLHSYEGDVVREFLLEALEDERASLHRSTRYVFICSDHVLRFDAV